MEVLQTVLLVVQVFVAITLIGFILIQHGKGADAGAAFGSGASGTVFGSQGSGNFMTKTTTFLAVVFLANSLALGYMASQREAPGSLMENTELMEQVEVDKLADKMTDVMEQEAEGVDAALTEEDMDMPAEVPEPATDSDLPALPE